ncbi:hypothetical protein [Rhizobium sp. SSA_523]|uniref:hypothetical protein n=1 Tax=Rhizobium sp. SSA_523 TaxID=2952477 RepID=UPI0020901EEF|nr:hypothetical protein [Rhizobium sp. SSA_523]MCO5734095.1 hypothetical protein [Rhizobium sp. SSA_523]WKC24733.1 hypothetical protein QTJ18_11950 [Rhizobium sp. SSA_523]
MNTDAYLYDLQSLLLIVLGFSVLGNCLSAFVIFTLQRTSRSLGYISSTTRRMFSILDTVDFEPIPDLSSATIQFCGRTYKVIEPEGLRSAVRDELSRSKLTLNSEPARSRSGWEFDDE